LCEAIAQAQSPSAPGKPSTETEKISLKIHKSPTITYERMLFPMISGEYH
jgi:hypothetical protein